MRLRPWRRPAVASDPAAPAEVVAGLVRDVLARDGEVVWRARGGSMRASVADGERLRLVPLPVGGPKPGEVVMAVMPDDRLVVHRVRAVRGGEIVLRGDSSRVPDPPVLAGQIVARVEPTPKATLRAHLYSLLTFRS